MDEKRNILLKNMGYSDKAIDILNRKSNLGEIENPSIFATQKGTCGDVMMLYLTIEDEIIRDARFEFIGCAGLQASGSGLTEMIKGKSIHEAKELEAKDIIEFLESLPAQKYECSSIASNTLHKALNDYSRKVPQNH